jgi:hypothetical protein
VHDNDEELMRAPLSNRLRDVQRLSETEFRTYFVNEHARLVRARDQRTITPGIFTYETSLLRIQEREEERFRARSHRSRH